MNILVIGALGTIGRKLVPELLAAGHRVSISSRFANKQAPWPETDCPRFTLNLNHYHSLAPALQDIELVYYLMHGMSDGQDHTGREVIAASNLADAAEKSGVQRIIYMGSLVSAKPKSEHMLARIATGKALASRNVAVTELRAGIVITPGSAAFEVMRDLVGHMPLAFVPTSIDTQAPPIALKNILYYLVKLADHPETGGQIFDAAGPKWISYRHLMLKIAEKLNKRISILAVPGLPIHLACMVLGLITSVPQSLAKSLLAGLSEQLQAKPDSLRQLIPQPLLSIEQALDDVFEEEKIITYPDRWQDGIPAFRNFSSLHGFYAKSAKNSTIIKASPEKIWQVLNLIGGKHRYFYLNSLWTLREWIDFAFGGEGHKHGRTDEAQLKVGDRIDSWTILTAQENRCLVMRFGMKAPGGGGMQMTITPVTSETCHLDIALYWHPAGFSGLLYWYFFAPWHKLLLTGMCKKIRQLAE